MTLQQRLTATKVLVLLGLVLMCGNYGIYKLGGPPELYPFFYWRLYSAPVGVDETTLHRLYTREAQGAAWERLPIRPTEAYPRKEYVWQFESLVGQVLRDSLSRTDARERLAVFAREIVPEAEGLKVVAETVYARDLARGTSHYDTTTVLRITQ